MLTENNIHHAASNPNAFTEIYERYDQRVYQYMRYRCNQNAEAQDLTAQVFERVLVNLPHYKAGAAPFEAWLFRIAANVFTDWYRRQRRRNWLPWNFLNRQAALDPHPEELLIRSENHVALQSALESLNQREREVIGLRFGARLTNRQIAAFCEISEQNTAIIIYRALKKLKGCLQMVDAEVKHE
jgi:RNA polymerase sigma-70 factor (ECF subfamily)